MFCFIIGLYGGMSVYVNHALLKIKQLREIWPDSRFVLVMDEKTSQVCSAYFEQEYVDIQTCGVKNNEKIISMLRFRVVFEHKYLEYTRVIIDVHDDIELLVKWVSKAKQRLQKTNKLAFFMYVKSLDEECPHCSSLHKSQHTHRDAGFSVWTEQCRPDITIFDAFLEVIYGKYAKYEYGADEVFVDILLNTLFDNTTQILQKNVFPSSLSQQDSETLPCKYKQTSKLHLNAKFKGNFQMCICSRVDY